MLLAAFVFAGCAAKKEDAHADGHGENPGPDDELVWQEMDDFHLIMAETFHPYKDSSNLDPVKRRAAELMASADQWASSPLPDKMDNAEVKAKLLQLKTEAAALAEQVRSADDNVIGEQLTKLHNTFHELQETWYTDP